jgi:hypothetical protein
MCTDKKEFGSNLWWNMISEIFVRARWQFLKQYDHYRNRIGLRCITDLIRKQGLILIFNYLFTTILLLTYLWFVYNVDVSHEVCWSWWNDPNYEKLKTLWIVGNLYGDWRARKHGHHSYDKPLRYIPSIVSRELTRSSTVKQCKRILLILHDPRRYSQ